MSIIDDIKKLSDTKTVNLIAVSKQIHKINDNLNKVGILEKREMVRQTKNIHPFLKNFIENLSNYQAVSEYVLSSFMGYTVDKPALLVTDWGRTDISQYTPLAIRKNILPKISSDVTDEIEKSYRNLNEKFASNISLEDAPKKSATGKTLKRRIAFNTAHAHHIVGDALWYNDHIIPNDPTSLKSLIILELIKTIKNLTNKLEMINYITPVNMDNIKKENTTYNTTVEGNDISVNNRNDKVVYQFTNVNNKAITPTPTE